MQHKDFVIIQKVIREMEIGIELLGDADEGAFLAGARWRG